MRRSEDAIPGAMTARAAETTVEYYLEDLVALLVATRGVLDNWEDGDLGVAVRTLARVAIRAKNRAAAPAVGGADRYRQAVIALCAHAQRVVGRWEQGDLAEAVNVLRIRAASCVVEFDLAPIVIRGAT